MMKKLVLGVVLLAVLVVGGGLGYLFLTFPNVPPPEDVRIEATPERLARGEYLAKHVTGCVDCHAERDWTKYGGPTVPGTAGRGGESFVSPVFTVYAKNITPAAVGQWTDGELIRAFTAGVSRDGTALFPIMPYPRYARLSREDVESIVAYIRSLDPMPYDAPPRKLSFPLPLVVRTIPKAPEFRPIPSKTDRVAYGEYMTNAAACTDCHTPQDNGQPHPGMDFAGGFEFPLPNGGVVRSANLTPDADTGLGTWTEQQFVDKFKAFEGIAPRPLSPAEQRENTVMPWVFYSGMTDEDLRVIYAYLRTLPPVINRVVKNDPR